MRQVTSLLSHILVVLVLTLLTQIGGAAYLAALLVTRRWRDVPRWRAAHLAVATIAIYAVASIAIVPPLAAQFNRVRIPCAASTLVGCVLNRTYARPQLADLIEVLNARLARDYPGSGVTVLDAGFPFVAGFPLLPHLGHTDGKKVDLAFFYQSARSGQPIPSGSPSPIGYFHFQQPPADAAPLPCHFVRNRWSFSWLQPEKPAWLLDRERTRAMIRWWNARPEVMRIFLEPHLAQSLGVDSGKVHFQGCFAARHDDHLHVEIR
jgi:hypothetical protein